MCFLITLMKEVIYLFVLNPVLTALITVLKEIDPETGKEMVTKFTVKRKNVLYLISQSCKKTKA